MRAKFVPHASTVLPAVLEKFKEKKPLVKDALVECIDVITTHVSYIYDDGRSEARSIQPLKITIYRL